MRFLRALEQYTIGYVLHYRLYKYLILEFVPYFFGGVMVVLIFMGGNAVLFNMMEHIISKQVPPEVYLKVLMLQMPTFLVMGLPMAGGGLAHPRLYGRGGGSAHLRDR